MQIKIADKTKKVSLTTPKATAKILINILKAEEPLDKMKEHFWGIYLNSRNYITRIELISLGTLNASLVHPREVLKPAIESSAASMIIAHNHPSNDSEPSEDDLLITKQLTEASKIMGIDLLDSIVITTKGTFSSFKEKGLL